MTVGSVVFGLPLYFLLVSIKYDRVALLAGMSLSLRRMCPKRAQRDFRICNESGFSWHFLYRDLFVILIGYFMLSILLSCLRWNALSFSSSVWVSAHVPQLYRSMDLTSALYRWIFVNVFNLLPRVHRWFSLFRARDESCFLLSTSCESPMSDPTFLTFFHCSSLLDIDVYSVLSVFTLSWCVLNT